MPELKGETWYLCEGDSLTLDTVDARVGEGAKGWHVTDESDTDVKFWDDDLEEYFEVTYDWHGEGDDKGRLCLRCPEAYTAMLNEHAEDGEPLDQVERIGWERPEPK